MLHTIKQRSFLPWLIALGFALLFLSVLFGKSGKNEGFTTKPNLIKVQTSFVSPPLPHESVKVEVARIIDGDTIELADKTRVRYIGIDTSESDDCFGTQASLANSGLVLDKKITLENDVQLLDRYGRTLAYVWTENIMVNEEMVRRGYAKVSTFPPNIRYQDKFIKAEREAREAQLGLWAANVCNAAELQTSTKLGNSQTSETSNTNINCLIKGNVSSSGEKIYHAPGQRYYEKTKIEEEKGERWFCSETEAEIAGWRKSKI